jgi:hypothetical protein
MAKAKIKAEDLNQFTIEFQELSVKRTWDVRKEILTSSKPIEEIPYDFIQSRKGQNVIFMNVRGLV